MTGTSKFKAARRFGPAIASVLLVAAFALPSSALATSQCTHANSDPTEAQYCSPASVHGGNDKGGVKGVTGAGGNENSPAGTEATVEPAPAAEVQAVESSGSSLPFTGLDLGVLAIVAVLLAGTGLILRRLSAPRGTQS